MCSLTQSKMSGALLQDCTLLRLCGYKGKKTFVIPSHLVAIIMHLIDFGTAEETSQMIERTCSQKMDKYQLKQAEVVGCFRTLTVPAVVIFFYQTELK